MNIVHNLAMYQIWILVQHKIEIYILNVGRHFASISI
jgi:hypothetical protein